MPYTPSPLHFDKGDYIRLLTLAPSAFDDDIECDLIFASVDHLPYFEALSYCWGNQHDRGLIRLCGIEHQATTNLITALRYLRYVDRLRILWVDALCINQSNRSELSHQILHMTNIYSKAHRVLAWVGTNEWEPAAAFAAIRRRAQNGGVFEEHSLAAVQYFFSSPYWDRLWVVQEIALAGDVVIICGQEFLSWHTIQELLAPNAAGRRIPDGLPYHMRRGFWKVRHLWHTRELLHAGHTPTFLQTLNKFNPCQCSLSKDNVYAVLGMCTDTVRDIVRPDHTRTTSIEEAFCQATVACIVEQQNLDVLSFVRRWTEFGSFSVSGDAPKPLARRTSWAGEWSTVRIIRPLLEPDDPVQIYAAAPGSSFNKNEMIESAKNGMLRLNGLLFDTLISVENQINPYIEGLETSVKAWEPEGLDNYEYPTGENAIDAFWRSLVYDTAYATFHLVHERLGKEQIPRYRKLYLDWSGRSEEDKGPSIETNEESGNNSFFQCLKWGSNFNCLHGWTFCTSGKGYFVRAQPDARKEDVVAIVSGSPVPLLLRPAEQPESAQVEESLRGQSFWRLVGSAYVHGLMDSEAFTAQGLLDARDIYLV